MRSRTASLCGRRRDPVLSVPLRLHHKLAYGLGQLGDAIVHFSFETFVFFYYTQVLGLSGTLAGLAVLIALLFDAVSDPLVGALSDETRSRLGRRHPFMWLGPLPLAGCFVLVFVPPEGLGSAGLFAWLLGFSVLARAFLTLFAVPHLSLGAELSSDYVGRTWIVATRMSFAAVGWVGAAAGAFFVFFRSSEAWPVGHLNPEPYPAFALCFAAVMVAAQLGSAAGTQAPARRLPGPAAGAGGFRPTTLVRDILGAVRTVSFRWFLLAGVFVAVATGMRQTLILHMNTFFWELTSEETGTVLVATLVALLVGYPLWAALSRRIEKRSIYQLGMGIAGAFALLAPLLRWLGWLPDNDAKALLIPAVAVLGLVSVLGSTGTQLVQASMAADMADESALETGRRQEGVFLGALNLLTKSAAGLGHLVAGVALDWIHFPANAVPGEVAPGVVASLGWVYGFGVLVFAGLSAAVIGRYGLSRERVGQIQQRLAAEMAT